MKSRQLESGMRAVVRPRALLYDLDGTLIDSRKDIAEACNETLRSFGRTPQKFEAIVAMIGDGAKTLIARVFGVREDDPIVSNAVTVFRQFYTAKPCVHTTLLPGAREALHSGVRAALVTNKPRDITLLVLEALGISNAFEMVWAADGPLKPSPAGVVAALEALHIDASDAWFVGDGAQDIGAAKAAGVFVALVAGIGDHGSAHAAGPDLLLPSLSALLPYLR
ncbi:MAG: HAD-IA family hydrolase [Polyangiaceae bacterium]|nr:HAD-IA family hydrolase [Polyangiaceae bacterium]